LGKGPILGKLFGERLFWGKVVWGKDVEPLIY
jgi:hypothetical protein